MMASHETYMEIFWGMVKIWRFPEIGVPPVLIHFNGIFHEINHPAMGVPHGHGNPHIVVIHSGPRHMATPDDDLEGMIEGF